MKTLSLLRHAHAKALKSSEVDAQRRLSARGRREAASLAQRFAPASAKPFLCICSTARRAVETLDELLKARGWPSDAEVAIEDGLYMASATLMKERLSRIDDRVTDVLLIGHNPGIGMLARDLTRSEDVESKKRLLSDYPPASMAVLQFDAPRWSDVAKSGGRLVDFVIPG